MKVYHKHGSRERLFEMMCRVNKLDEDVLPKNKREEIIDKFISETCEYLGLDENSFNVELSYDPQDAQKMRSFGKHTPMDGNIMIVVANRNLADILRTLAHEMVHRKQLDDGRLYMGAGDDGSEIENEANAQAAIIMRKFGRDNPIIFE